MNIEKSLTIPNKDAAKIKLAVFDFDGVFTDNSVWISKRGEEYVRCSRGDGFGLKRLRELNIFTYVLSTEINPIVGIRCQKMQIPYLQGIQNKAEELKYLSKKLKINLDNTSYLGNDINDLGCLQIVGVPIAVKDSYKEVLQSARYKTTKKGGYGAVREVCDWIFENQNGKI